MNHIYQRRAEGFVSFTVAHYNAGKAKCMLYLKKERKICFTLEYNVIVTAFKLSISFFLFLQMVAETKATS